MLCDLIDKVNQIRSIFCKHDFIVERTVDYGSSIKIVFYVCKKCGRTSQKSFTTNTNKKVGDKKC